MKRFGEGVMYRMVGHGFDPIKIVSRSKSGKTVVCQYGNGKPFRLKVREHIVSNSEYVVADPSYKEGSAERWDLTCFAEDALTEAEQREWEEMYERSN